MFNTWKMQNAVSVMPKMAACAADMVVWGRERCNKLKIDIEECRRQIQNSRLNSTGARQDQIVNLRKKMSRLLSQDDAYWRQRAKTHWYRDGDRNTKLFHASSTARKKVNRILSLEDHSGNKVSDSKGMCDIAKQYFLDLFQKKYQCCGTCYSSYKAICLDGG